MKTMLDDIILTYRESIKMEPQHLILCGKARRMYVNFLITFRDTGYLKEQCRGHEGIPARPEMLQYEKDILEIVKDDLTMSTRAIAAQVDVPHYECVQTLPPEDHPGRVASS